MIRRTKNVTHSNQGEKRHPTFRQEKIMSQSQSVVDSEPRKSLFDHKNPAYSLRASHFSYSASRISPPCRKLYGEQVVKEIEIIPDREPAQPKKSKI